MDPNRSASIETVLRGDLSNNQKIETLLPEQQDIDIEDYKNRFNAIIENTLDFAGPLDNGIDDPIRRSQSFNFKTPPLKILSTEQGDLILDILVYCPSNPLYGRSITTHWHLNSPNQNVLVFEEYLSDRSFEPGIAAYRPDATQIVELLEGSLAAYKAAAKEPTS